MMGDGPSRLELIAQQEREKIYFIDWRGEPTLLTPGQMEILKTISKQYEKELEAIEELSSEIFMFILKVVEAERQCTAKAAAELKLSPNTVYTQLSRVKERLNCKSNLQLLLLYSMTVKDFSLKQKQTQGDLK
jgi:DNA-binding CsgD family transcriptional regulator